MKHTLLAISLVASATTALGAFAQDELPPDEREPEYDVPDGVIDPTETDVDVDVDVGTTPAAPAPIAAPVASDGTPSVLAPLRPTRDNLQTLLGGEIKLGVGGGDFTGDRAQSLTGAGFNWDVRGVFGGNFPIGVEAAYIGSSRNISNSFAQGSGDTQLVSNGLEGDVRLALPVRASELVDIRPFAFGGLGWQYMTMWGDAAVDGARDEGDHILTVPAGVGIDMGVGPLNVDLRGTYRHAVGSELFGDAGSGFNDPNALHTYAFTAAVGLEF